MSIKDYIVKALDFIESHLKEDIQIEDMAATCGYSLYHFCRTFSKVVHFSPYEYLMRRRLSAAALEVIYTRKKIIDIAMTYQINNPEVFSRVFKRQFGIQPLVARKQSFLDPFRLLPALTDSHLIYFAQVLNHFKEEASHFENEILLYGFKQCLDLQKNFDLNPIMQKFQSEVNTHPFKQAEVWGKFVWTPAKRQCFLFFGTVGKIDGLYQTKILPGRYAAYNHVGSFHLLNESLRWLSLTGKRKEIEKEFTAVYKIEKAGDVKIYV